MKKLLLLLLISSPLLAQKISKKDYLLTIETTQGTMHAVLFEDTPKHRQNFLNLVEKGFYEDLLFHRVINEFMIQGGDPESKDAPAGKRLGNGGDKLPKVPFEFTQKHIHLKGALAAARSNNPKKVSSGCQFYIVTGKPRSESESKAMGNKMGLNYSDEQIEAYKTLGGTPWLDNNYTVFGEIIDGITAADKIQKVETDGADRPLVDQKFTISAKRMKKKKITKLYGYSYE
ncbi:peptidylprolyl isomerase [Jiulongibacter sp. NS-SX5]|uniref:peptidylprolyl isomerase n=1 Tax=Jiulongibacter sp. NS-SX5 TaxID=3463854 RepID=UPI0040588D1C